jgi:hypothetical protein
MIYSSLQLPSKRGRMLSGPVPADFEAYYREHLRWRSGRRIGVIRLRERYQAWAIEAEAQSLSLKQLKKAMIAVGHRHATSNGTYYFDVEFADQLPDVPDNFPSPAPKVAP